MLSDTGLLKFKVWYVPFHVFASIHAFSGEHQTPVTVLPDFPTAVFKKIIYSVCNILKPMKEIQWLPIVYCCIPFQPPLAYVNHIIARFAGRLKGIIRKNAGGRNVKAGEKFGNRLQKINDQGIAVKNTTIFVCTIAYQLHVSAVS
jgi:hypothetical protein